MLKPAALAATKLMPAVLGAALALGFAVALGLTAALGLATAFGFAVALAFGLDAGAAFITGAGATVVAGTSAILAAGGGVCAIGSAGFVLQQLLHISQFANQPSNPPNRNDHKQHPKIELIFTPLLLSNKQKTKAPKTRKGNYLRVLIKRQVPFVKNYLF